MEERKKGVAEAQRREEAQKIVENRSSTKVREEIGVEKRRERKKKALNTYPRKIETRETQRTR